MLGDRDPMQAITGAPLRLSSLVRLCCSMVGLHHSMVLCGGWWHAAGFVPGLFASTNRGLVLIKKWKKVFFWRMCCGAACRFPPVHGSCSLPQQPGTPSRQLLALEIAVL